MNRAVKTTFIEGEGAARVLDELDRRPLLVVGGRQRTHRSLRDGEGWYGYGAGVVLRIDGSGVTTVLEYQSKPGTCTADDPVLFKAASYANGRLYCCTQTEVVIFRINGSHLVEESHISLPMFNDVHHVVPTPTGTLLVAISGLELVIEMSTDGEVLAEWDMLGEPTWERLDPSIDYRMGVNLKPHRAHPNHIALVDGEPFITRFELRDVVSLRDPSRRICPGGERLHDGVLHDGRIWFTSVDGEVISVDAHTLEVIDRVRLHPLAGREPILGWCRGLRFVPDAEGRAATSREAWVGFSRIRATQFRQTLSWIRHRGVSQAPTRIARYDLDTGRCLAEIDLEPYGLNAVFSVVAP